MNGKANTWKGLGRALTPVTFVATLAVAALAASCSHPHAAPTAPTGSTSGDSAMSDFSLVDVNPNSITSGQEVSPRQFLGKISAWYFGHAT